MAKYKYILQLLQMVTSLLCFKTKLHTLIQAKALILTFQEKPFVLLYWEIIEIRSSQNNLFYLQNSDLKQLNMYLWAHTHSHETHQK